MESAHWKINEKLEKDGTIARNFGTNKNNKKVENYLKNKVIARNLLFCSHWKEKNSKTVI